MEEYTIGQRIAAKRKELGLSQIALGEEMGVSRQSISKWEADAAIPEIDKLIALSKLFGVSVGWLLGVEDGPEPAQEADTEFTDREWEIIDQLTQSQTKLPKWLIPLTAAVTAIALFAVIIAGSAFSTARSYREDLASVSQAIAILTAGTGNGVSDSTMLESYQFLLKPSGDLSYCNVEFLGTPPSHPQGTTAELLIFADGEEVCRESCSWNGVSYSSKEFFLWVRNGYTIFFTLTSKDGIVRSTVLMDQDMNRMADAAAFGNVSVEYGEYQYEAGTLTLRDIDFTIDLPDLFRDTADAWSRCDLVVLGDGQELGRVDILNRSKYSKKANFSENFVDFYSQSQSITIGDIGAYSRIELMLDCGFTLSKDQGYNPGLDMQKCIKTWTVHDGKI